MQKMPNNPQNWQGPCSYAHVLVAMPDRLPRQATGLPRRGYGTTSVGCRGGRGYVEGCWGFPYLKIKRFVGLLVFCFFGVRLLIFGCCFLGVVVSWFLGFRILPNFHFMFSGAQHCEIYKNNMFQKCLGIFP